MKGMGDKGGLAGEGGDGRGLGRKNQRNRDVLGRKEDKGDSRRNDAGVATGQGTGTLLCHRGP